MSTQHCLDPFDSPKQATGVQSNKVIADSSKSCYQAALEDPGPLQSHRDAIEEDENQDHVVKELVSNDGLAEGPEPGRGKPQETM